MNDCHPDCDRCDGCGAHILPDEARCDIPAVSPEEDEWGWGWPAFHVHQDCDPALHEDEGPHPGCREFVGEGWRAHDDRMHRERGCVRWEEVTR